MGAEFMIERVKANTPRSRTVEQVYNYLVNTAQYESGHGGYTGTIAESPGFTFVKEQFYSFDRAEEYLEKHCCKWEDTLVVSVASDKGEYWLFGGIYSC